MHRNVQALKKKNIIETHWPCPYKQSADNFCVSLCKSFSQLLNTCAVSVHVWWCRSMLSRLGSESHTSPLTGRRLAKSVFNCFYLALESKWHASGMTERLLQHGEVFFLFRKPALTHTLPLKSLVLDSGLRRSQNLIFVPSRIPSRLLRLDKYNTSSNLLIISLVMKLINIKRVLKIFQQILQALFRNVSEFRNYTQWPLY